MKYRTWDRKEDYDDDYLYDDADDVCENCGRPYSECWCDEDWDGDAEGNFWDDQTEEERDRFIHDGHGDYDDQLYNKQPCWNLLGRVNARPLFFTEI